MGLFQLAAIKDKKIIYVIKEDMKKIKKKKKLKKVIIILKKSQVQLIING